MSIPKEHVHIPCLTPWIDFVGILGFQSMALRYQTPCICYLEKTYEMNPIGLKRNYIQGVLQRSVILWKPRIPTKTIHGVINVICTCSFGMDIWFFTFRINFELRG